MVLRTKARQTHRAQKVVETIVFIENGEQLACCENASFKGSNAQRTGSAASSEPSRMGWMLRQIARAVKIPFLPVGLKIFFTSKPMTCRSDGDWAPSGNQGTDNIAMDIGETEISPSIAEGKSLMIKTQEP